MGARVRLALFLVLLVAGFLAAFLSSHDLRFAVLGAPARRAAVLSSSRLEACVNDGSEELECETKIVVAITLEHGQEDVESAEFRVREVLDSGGLTKMLKKQLKVTWEKSPAYWRYPIRYVQDVNNKPKELIMKTGTLQCSDNPSRGADATCGVAKDGQGNIVPDSEGFCCGCDLNDQFSSLPTRGRLDCNPFSMPESAHCLGFDPSWYSVYEVYEANVVYDISVKLSKPVDSDVSWTDVQWQITELRLSHQQPVASSNDGDLRLQLVGDLATAESPHNFASKYLVIPSEGGRVNETHPIAQAMLIDRSAFSLDGKQCDKIGVSYSAFKWQTDKCEKPAGSCLGSQLDDFHKEDVEREGRGEKPIFFVRGKCGGAVELGREPEDSMGRSLFLGCPMTQRHTTLLRLEVRADEAMFIQNVAHGEIAAASAFPFEALSGNGEVIVTIVSGGPVTASFWVGVTNCSEGITTGPAASVSLEPYESSKLRIRLIASQMGGGKHKCTVTLSNAIEKMIDSLVVDFEVSSTRVTTGVQVPVDRDGATILEAASGRGDVCEEKCDSFFDVFCLLWYSCWNKLGSLAFVVLGFVAGASFLFSQIKSGALCRCIARCLCPFQSGGKE